MGVAVGMVKRGGNGDLER